MPTWSDASWSDSAWAGDLVTTSPVYALSSTAPKLVVEIDVSSTSPLSGSPVWTDISQYVTGMETKRGRQHELSRVEAGTMRLELDNRDGRFSPFNGSSPYSPNVLPMRPVRVRAFWQGVLYPLFRGFIESWPIHWPDAANATVDINAVDAFKVLNLKKLIDVGYSAAVLADAPLLYWRFGEKPGASQATDSSGNGRHGTYRGGIVLGAQGALVDPDTAADQNGIAVAGVLSNASLPHIGTGAFSLEFWLFMRSTVGNNVIAWDDDSLPIPDVFLSFDVNNAGVGTARFNRPSTADVNLAGGAASLLDNAWHHIVIRRVAGQNLIQLWLDGARTSELGPNGTTFDFLANPIQIGISFGDQNFVIDEVAAYDTALTDAQITNHYQIGVGFPGETTGGRINRILDGIDWNATDRAIDVGVSTVQAFTTSDLNESGLSLAQTVTDTETGLLFVDPAGRVTFYDRHRTLLSPYNKPAIVLGEGNRSRTVTDGVTNNTTTVTSATANFTDGDIGAFIQGSGIPAGATIAARASTTSITISATATATASGVTLIVAGNEEPYLVDTVDLQFDDLDIYNEVAVTRRGGVAQVSSDATSQAAFVARTLTFSDLLMQTDSEAAAKTGFELGRHKNALQRVRAVSFTPYSDPTMLFPAALGFDLWVRTTFKRRPHDAAASLFSQDSVIEGIEHRYEPGRWLTRWLLSPQDAVAFWILDDPIYSVLGTTTRLAY